MKNVAFFLTPKQNVACLYDDFTLRQGLEKLKHHGYTAIPVITRDNKYVGTVSEGDFLWHVVRSEGIKKVSMLELEDLYVKDILRPEHNPPVDISTGMEELLNRAMNQNFIPVVDDLGSFIGIVTRKDIIRYFYQSTLDMVFE